MEDTGANRKTTALINTLTTALITALISALIAALVTALITALITVRIAALIIAGDPSSAVRPRRPSFNGHSPESSKHSSPSHTGVGGGKSSTGVGWGQEQYR